MSDWAKVKQKTQQGKEWRDHVNVPLGLSDEDEESDDDEALTAEVAYRLIPEEQYLEIVPQIDLETLDEYQDEGMSDAEERLQELQNKDDLTEDEEEELNELHDELRSHRLQMMNDLGEETFKAIQLAGKIAIYPDAEDVQDALSMDPQVQQERFGDTLRTEEEAEDALKAEMNEVLTDNPFLIKYTIGQKAINESQTAMGNS